MTIGPHETLAQTDPPESETAADLHYRIAERFAPPSVLINAANELIHMSHRAACYFQPAGSGASQNVFERVLPTFASQLGQLLESARLLKQHATLDISFQRDGSDRTLTLSTHPIDHPTGGASCFLVLFENDNEVPPQIDEAVASRKAELAPHHAQPRSREIKSILVVDDAANAADILALFFRVEGFGSEAAYNGAQAVEKAEATKPDLIFLDLSMPIMNGMDAARRIRKQQWGQDMILVALTSWGQEADRIKTRDAGFDYHLVKPVDPKTLRAFLKNLQAA